MTPAETIGAGWRLIVLHDLVRSSHTTVCAVAKAPPAMYTNVPLLRAMSNSAVPVSSLSLDSTGIAVPIASKRLRLKATARNVPADAVDQMAGRHVVRLTSAPHQDLLCAGSPGRGPPSANRRGRRSWVIVKRTAWLPGKNCGQR